MPPDRTFEVEFDMGHPMPSLDQRMSLAHSGVGQLHAVASLAEVDFLLLPDGLRQGPQCLCGLRIAANRSIQRSKHWHRPKGCYGSEADLARMPPSGANWTFGEFLTSATCQLQKLRLALDHFVHTSDHELTMATPPCEGPRLIASRLIARSGRSTRIS